MAGIPFVPVDRQEHEETLGALSSAPRLFLRGHTDVLVFFLLSRYPLKADPHRYKTWYFINSLIALNWAPIRVG